MTTRNGIDFPVLWLLVDAGHARYAQLLSAAETQHTSRLDAVLSVNARADGLRSLVKVAAAQVWVDGLSAQLQAAILRVFTDVDHGEARVLVRDAAWTG